MTDPGQTRPPRNRIGHSRNLRCEWLLLLTLAAAAPAGAVNILHQDAEQPAAPNRVKDPSVETNGWRCEQGACIISPGRTGNGAVRIERDRETQTPTSMGEADRVSEGTWTLSAWMRCATTQGADRNFSAELRVHWLDAQRARIHASRGPSISGRTPTWVYREATVTAPPGAVAAHLAFGFTGAIVGCCDLDDVVLTRTPDAKPMQPADESKPLIVIPAQSIFAPGDPVSVAARLESRLAPGVDVVCLGELRDSLGHLLARGSAGGTIPRAGRRDLSLSLVPVAGQRIPSAEWLCATVRVCRRKETAQQELPRLAGREIARGSSGVLQLPRPDAFQRRPDSPFALLVGHAYTKRWLGARWERPNRVNERLLELPYRYGVCCMPMIPVPHERIDEEGVAQAFRAEVADYVQQHARYLDYLQLGNEPPLFRPGVTEAYVRALRIGYEAAKAAKPMIKIAAAGITGLNVDEEMIARFLDAGGAAYCDMIDIHTYLPLAEMDRIIAKVRSQMQERGVNKPLIITEVTANLGAPIPEREKAGHIYQRYAIALSHGVSQVYWFVMHWVNALPGGFRYCGLIDSLNHAPWPAAAAYWRLAQTLEPLEFRQRWVRNDAWVFLFRKASRSAVIAWSHFPGTRIELDNSVAQAVCFDVNGRPFPLDPDRECSIDLTSEPILVCFKSPSAIPTLLFDGYDQRIRAARGAAVVLPLAKGGDLLDNPVIRRRGLPAFLQENFSTQLVPDLRLDPNAQLGRTEAWLLVQTGRKQALRRFPIRVTEPLQVSMMPVPTPDGGARVDVTVRNLSAQPINGSMILETALTQNARPRRMTVRFNELAPAETAQIPCELDAPPDPAATYPTQVHVLTSGNARTVLRKNLVFAPAQRAHPVPTIDGSLREWNDFPIAVTARSGARRDPEASDADDPGDISAVAAVRWTPHSLIVAARVVDDVHHNARRDGALWDGDSLQIALAPTPAKQDAERCEASVGNGSGGPQVWVTRNLAGRPTGPVTWPVAIRREGNHTLYEVTIPWRDISDSPLAVGTCLGFGFLVNEDDGKGRGWLGWHHGIASDKNPARYGQLQLVDWRNTNR